MNDELTRLVAAKREFGLQVCHALAAQIDKLGFAEQQRPCLPEFDVLQFRIVVDPFSQSRDLVGVWHDARNQRIGQIKFHGDGSFYAEYDVVQPHPTKKQFFVEAVTAWGNPNNIKTEAKLLEMPNG